MGCQDYKYGVIGLRIWGKPTVRNSSIFIDRTTDMGKSLFYASLDRKLFQFLNETLKNTQSPATIGLQIWGKKKFIWTTVQHCIL